MLMLVSSTEVFLEAASFDDGMSQSISRCRQVETRDKQDEEWPTNPKPQAVAGIDRRRCHLPIPGKRWQRIKSQNAPQKR